MSTAGVQSESGWVVSVTYIQIWSRLRRIVLNDRWHQPVSNPGSRFSCILHLFISPPTARGHRKASPSCSAPPPYTPSLDSVRSGWIQPSGPALHFCSRNISVFRSLVRRHFFWILIEGINDKSVQIIRREHTQTHKQLTRTHLSDFLSAPGFWFLLLRCVGLSLTLIFLPVCSGKVHYQEFLSVCRRIAYEFDSHLSFLPAAFMTLLAEGKFLSGLKLPALQFIVPAITTRWPRFAVPIYLCPGWFYPTG